MRIASALTAIQNEDSDLEGLSDVDNDEAESKDVERESVRTSVRDKDDEESSEDMSDDGSSSELENNYSIEANQSGDRGGRWINSDEFNPAIVPFQISDDHDEEMREDWQPSDYVGQYLDEELMKLIANCTNRTYVSKTGDNFKTSAAEIHRFLGTSIFMSCVGYPRVRMFWSNSIGIPAVYDTFSRNRYFKIRNNIKVVVDDDVPEDDKKADSFWKVRPLVKRVRQGCLQLRRPHDVSVDEQMIAFTGACPFRQYVANKPNPVGLKIFVAASSQGLVLDFEIYQGPKSFPPLGSDVNIGLGRQVVAHLSQSLPEGTKIYYDRYFTGLNLIDYMLTKNIYVTGTVMKNRVNEPVKKLMDDKTMQRLQRGTCDSTVRRDGHIALIKWFDNKPILMASSVHGKLPQDSCRRWSKKDKQYIQVSRPSIIKEYNCKMGGVDLCDRMLSYYKMHIRSKKWTVRTMMHFVDLALVNAWFLYRQDMVARDARAKDIMQYLMFRMDVAETFMATVDTPIILLRYY